MGSSSTSAWPSEAKRYLSLLITSLAVLDCTTAARSGSYCLDVQQCLVCHTAYVFTVDLRATCSPGLLGSSQALQVQGFEELTGNPRVLGRLQPQGHEAVLIGCWFMRLFVRESHNALYAWRRTLAPAANFLACSTPLAARLQKTSESLACSLGLLTAPHCMLQGCAAQVCRLMARASPTRNHM